ncbi:aminotransferase class V-fold PLP-dependent enzyme [Natrarchaeobius halalkaliphilus]|uniref:Aminotransferase class V-fold PLP-dependent enzyme n=1 Tax=Natrarchaeobius halalkaliphilus TaxID=1679091 RepID=A0A3N6NYW5_9EURY|nr:aminotransferase class V-fold PLP-dependent enzyme [Natrarchaeobius halalkaliphilus]RQG86666.1 aminotransferase class V-fold PLP-dependent enzyme [Natrarchaeobius halalkaliphilus]
MDRAGEANSIYDELGVPPVINATGTKTRIGGSRIRTGAIDAMNRASESFVRLSDLQAEASARIAEITGAQAGYVTSGAAAGLLLGAAAALAGHDIQRMDRLPETAGIPDEIVMPRTHRTGYDHAFRATGATIVDVGTNDRHLGTGSTNVEPWEIEAAITAETAAIGYIEKPYTGPPLGVVTEIAHEHDIPVIVDAAAELPPTTNFSRFIDDGADLVVFSGGKAIRGPQTTGIVAGRKDLIQSMALQHLDMHAASEVWEPPERLIDLEEIDGVPRQGIGRPMKVGKEELVGLIVALESFLEEDQAETNRGWHERAVRISEELSKIEGIKTTVTVGNDVSVAPETIVRIDPDEAGISASELVRALRSENPRVFVGADRLDENVVTINPMCLEDGEPGYVLDRIWAHAGPESDEPVSERDVANTTG